MGMSGLQANSQDGASEFQTCVSISRALHRLTDVVQRAADIFQELELEVASLN